MKLRFGNAANAIQRLAPGLCCTQAHMSGSDRSCFPPLVRSIICVSVRNLLTSLQRRLEIASNYYVAGCIEGQG